MNEKVKAVLSIILGDWFKSNKMSNYIINNSADAFLGTVITECEGNPEMENEQLANTIIDNL